MAERAHRYSLVARLMMVLGLWAALVSGQAPAAKPISQATFVVTDPSGAVIANANVTIQGKVTLTTRTSLDGSVHLTLPYGYYEVTIASNGFKPLRIAKFIVDAPKLPVRTVTLQLGDYGFDEFPSEVVAVPTLPSELPNSIEEKAGATAHCARTAHMRIYSDTSFSEETGDVAGYELALQRRNESTVEAVLFIYEGAANDDGIPLSGHVSGMELTIEGKWIEHLIKYPSKEESVQTHEVKIVGTLDSARFRGKITIDGLATPDRVRLKRVSHIWLCKPTVTP